MTFLPRSSSRPKVAKPRDRSSDEMPRAIASCLFCTAFAWICHLRKSPLAIIIIAIIIIAIIIIAIIMIAISIIAIIIVAIIMPIPVLSLWISEGA